MTLPRALAGWLVLFVVAFLNGTARVIVYQPFLGELRAHQVSTALGIVLLAAAMWLLTGWWRFQSAGQAWGTGMLWCAMTVLFEFGFGRAMGYSWERLLADYAFWEGRFWAFVPLWVLVAPALFHRLRSGAPQMSAVSRK
ncbi:MAG TPA: hypothetical protein VN442_23410 [Bryobacteraceae bacterium]|nr:hypothetical protein [Bryobacteraceae bacterium]